MTSIMVSHASIQEYIINWPVIQSCFVLGLAKDQSTACSLYCDFGDAPFLLQ